MTPTRRSIAALLGFAAVPAAAKPASIFLVPARVRFADEIANLNRLAAENDEAHALVAAYAADWKDNYGDAEFMALWQEASNASNCAARAFADAEEDLRRKVWNAAFFDG